MPVYCVVYKKGAVKGSVTIHQFPPLSNPKIQQQWLKALNLKPEDIKSHHYECSHHFRNRDTNNPPSLHLGKRFASPKKLQTSRGLRAQKWQLSFSPPLVSPTPVNLHQYTLLLFQVIVLMNAYQYIYTSNWLFQKVKFYCLMSIFTIYQAMMLLNLLQGSNTRWVKCYCEQSISC